LQGNMQAREEESMAKIGELKKELKNAGKERK
jgi:hypothetical protein